MASIADIENLLDRNVGTIVDTINKCIDKNEMRTEEAHTRIDGVDGRLKRVELKLASGGGTTKADFMANHVVISNFCEWEERKQKGIDRPQAEALMERVKQLMPASIQPKVGDVHLRGLRVHKIRVDVTPPYVGEVALGLKDILQTEVLQWQPPTRPDHRKTGCCGCKDQGLSRHEMRRRGEGFMHVRARLEAKCWQRSRVGSWGHREQ